MDSRCQCVFLLANSSKMCYTYDSLHRVTRRVVKSMTDDTVISDESFTYDAAGNVTDAPDGCFAYDTNNRLVVFNGINVSYDMDGNMLSNGEMCFAYDSANRLISAGGHTYVYNAEDVRIRNLCACEDTTYTYDTNCKLSMLLCKTTNGVTTKYVYGRGLIGEEAGNEFKTYHFDCSGSAIAMTDECGDITDTFAYDTYGKLISRMGTSEVIFGYNGRDGVVTDADGLIYMRARYYSPDMKRFVNADIVAGAISNAITLNRFAYANGNPVSFVDPFGLSAEHGGLSEDQYQIFVALLDELIHTSISQTFSYQTDIYSISYQVGALSFYQRSELKGGDGPVPIDELLKGQLEISSSLDLPMGTFTIVANTDDSLEVEYAIDIDEYNSASAAMILTPDSKSMEFRISTKYEDGLSLMTAMGIKRNNTVNQPAIEKSTALEGAYVFADAASKVQEYICDGVNAVGQGLVNIIEENPEIIVVAAAIFFFGMTLALA